MKDLRAFRNELVRWYERSRRDLPWRRTKDPYAIWLSEIMLQQTRVSAVIPYFERFLSRFPDVESLALAPEADLLAHWAGLGYYYRARNLQKAARAIVEARTFPASHGGILALPGVGDYTAAAIASIAFDLPFAVLDGNVFRVLSRLYADATDIASGLGKKHFAHIAGEVLDKERPGVFNQAMMELGATICLPKRPQCLLCPVEAQCAARRENRAAEFPIKLRRQTSVRKERTLFWIERGDELLVWQRPAESRLMPGFWELPERDQLPNTEALTIVGEFRHGITVHDFRFQVALAAAPKDLGTCVWKPQEKLAAAPMSTILRKAQRVVEKSRHGVRAKSAASS